MKNPFTLEGKNIIITGASSGIGQQCAILCAEMGAKVVLIGRNQERLKQTLSKMENCWSHHMMNFDLTKYDEMKDFVNRIVEKVGRIHGIVNCAGISMVSPFKMASIGKLEEIFGSNVFSAYLFTKEITKVGNFSLEGGSVIFLASVMGCVGESGKSLYGMSKGALISATRSLACELASKKIRVNTISPGAIITPINANAPYMTDLSSRQKLIDQHLLGLGTCEDVANAVVFLLSDGSRWVTGTNMVVDGGYTAK